MKFSFFLKIVLGVFLLLVVGLFLTGNSYCFSGISKTYFRGKTTASIDDAQDFVNDTLQNSQSFPFNLAERYNEIELTDSLKSYLKTYDTASFMVIRDKAIVYEEYYGEYEKSSKINSFSMAKSFTTMLLAAAIDDGYIRNFEVPISEFLNEYENDEKAQQCTVGDLSAMTAGYDWTEDYYFPLNPTAKAYYGDDIEKHVLSYGFDRESGKEFEYLSGATQLLGIIIERATKKKLPAYFEEKFWKPMGMESTAYWSLDKEGGMAKAYCCLHATTRDFAKFGQLMLQNGTWNGQQLLDKEFIKKATRPNVDKDYGYSFWIFDDNPDGVHDFYQFQGHLGQYIIVIPDKGIVIVRTGKASHLQEKIKGDNASLMQNIIVEEVYKTYEMKRKPIRKEE